MGAFVMWVITWSANDKVQRLTNTQITSTKGRDFNITNQPNIKPKTQT